MRAKFKQLIQKYFWFFVAFRRLVLRKKSYLHTTGWVESLKRGYPCERNGSEIPWMNYPVIKLLKERLNKDLDVFEYGSGYSTLFYAKLVRSVISIEYDQDWLELMQPKVPENVLLVAKEKDVDGTYCRSIAEYNQDFDVVIVDGRDRVNCVKQAMTKLSKAGVVVLDDSSRERYQEALEYAEDQGFRLLSIEGLKPTDFGTDQTTFIYRKDNCLRL